MTTANARGFLFLGLAMALLPMAASGAFPPTGIDGSNTRALWLGLVGWVQMAIGAAWLGQAAVARVASRLATFGLASVDRLPLVTGEPVGREPR
jgi:hypothetical protein